MKYKVAHLNLNTQVQIPSNCISIHALSYLLPLILILRRAVKPFGNWGISVEWKQYLQGHPLLLVKSAVSQRWIGSSQLHTTQIDTTKWMKWSNHRGMWTADNQHLHDWGHWDKLYRCAVLHVDCMTRRDTFKAFCSVQDVPLMLKGHLWVCSMGVFQAQCPHLMFWWSKKKKHGAEGALCRLDPLGLVLGHSGVPQVKCSNEALYRTRLLSPSVILDN